MDDTAVLDVPYTPNPAYASKIEDLITTIEASGARPTRGRIEQALKGKHSLENRQRLTDYLTWRKTQDASVPVEVDAPPRVPHGHSDEDPQAHVDRLIAEQAAEQAQLTTLQALRTTTRLDRDSYIVLLMLQDSVQLREA